MNHHETVKGVTGFLATAGSVTISLAAINEVLTFCSLCIGVIVGTLTLISILRNKKNPHKKNRNEY